MNRYIISVGSNCHSARINVAKAIKYLSCVLAEYKSSSVYSTPSTKNDGTFYHNAVVGGFSDLSVSAFNSLLKTYEALNGRKHGDREVSIDLDIVMVDDIVIRPNDYSKDYFIIGYRELG